MAEQGKKKTNKRPDGRPSRSSYWSKARIGQGLKAKKVRNMVRCNGLSPKAAGLLFEVTRKRRPDSEKLHGEAVKRVVDHDFRDPEYRAARKALGLVVPEAPNS